MIQLDNNLLIYGIRCVWVTSKYILINTCGYPSGDDIYAFDVNDINYALDNNKIKFCVILYGAINCRYDKKNIIYYEHKRTTINMLCDINDICKDYKKFLILKR